MALRHRAKGEVKADIEEAKGETKARLEETNGNDAKRAWSAPKGR